MISYLDSWSSRAILVDDTKLDRARQSIAATINYRSGLVAAALILGLSACTTSAAPKRPQPAPGRVFVKTRIDPDIRAAALAGWHPAPPDMHMRVDVFLTPVNTEEFNRTLAATADPRSPTFGHHLTHEDLQRSEWSMLEYEKIEHWLGSYGTKVLSADRAALVRTIRVEGTVAQFEAALNIRIDQSANGIWFANMSEPQIPSELKDLVAGFAGLDNLSAFTGGPGEIVQ